MTVYTYDCEFLEDGKTIDLISIGIVCEDGREYYAVNVDMDEDRIKHNNWLCENVIPGLPLRGKVERHTSGGGWYWSLDRTDTRVKPKWVIANEVRDFLLSESGNCSEKHLMPELWAYYGAYDHVALAQLFGSMMNLPTGIPMWTHELKQLLELSPIPLPEQKNEHNALDDARWNMTIYQLAEGRRGDRWTLGTGVK